MPVAMIRAAPEWVIFLVLLGGAPEIGPLPHLVFRRPRHAIARLARAIDCALNYSRSFCRFDKFAEIGKPRRLAFRNHQSGEVGPITVLKHPRAGQFGGIIEQRRADRCPGIHAPAPQQVESSIRSFRTDLFGVLCDAIESQCRGMIAHDSDANSRPICVGDALERRAQWD
jgi:hypothetical protein